MKNMVDMILSAIMYFALGEISLEGVGCLVFMFCYYQPPN